MNSSVNYNTLSLSPASLTWLSLYYLVINQQSCMLITVSMENPQLNQAIPCKLHVDRELLLVTKQKLALVQYPAEQIYF